MPPVSEIGLPIVHHLPKVTQSKKFVGDFKKSLSKSIGSLVEDYGRTYQTDLSRADELKKHGIFNDQQRKAFIKTRKEAYITHLVTSN